MKKLLLVAVALLGSAFVVSAILSVGFLTDLDQIWASRPEVEGAGRVVAVLLPSERDPFWDDLVVALRALGPVHRMDFEVTRYAPSGSNAREVLEKTSLSQVDALLCYPPESVDVTDVVDKAQGRGLPVLLLEADLPNSKRMVYLGASSFQTGHELGGLIEQRVGGARRGGIVLTRTTRDEQAVRNSLFLNGLNEGVSRYGGDLSFEVVLAPPGRFAGEELVWGLLRRDPGIQVLVTTNSKDTSSALQTVVEANRVGKTRLFGVGEDPALKVALQQGLVAGLVVRDPNEWAELVASTLDSVFSGESVTSYVNLPVHALVAAGASHGD